MFLSLSFLYSHIHAGIAHEQKISLLWTLATGDISTIDLLSVSVVGYFSLWKHIGPFFNVQTSKHINHLSESYGHLAGIFNIEKMSLFH